MLLPSSAEPPANNTPAYELSETALKLSRVIEREAQRRSALRSGAIFRVEQNFPMFRRVSSRLRSSVSRVSSRSRRSISSVVPTSDSPSSPSGAVPAIDSIKGGPLQPIAASPRASVVGRRSKSQSFSRNADGELIGLDGQPLTLQQRVWVFFDDPQSSAGAYYFSVSLFFFIALSTSVFIAQTEKALDPYRSTLNILEAVCAGVFSVEFTLRALSSPSKSAFFRNVGNYVDLAAILPFYLEAFLSVENAGSFGAIRIVRLTRVARVLKMSRYSSAIQVFVTAIAISMKALSMLLFLMAIAVVVFSSAVYFAEYTTDGCRYGGWAGACDVANVEYIFANSAGAASVASLATHCVCVDPNPYSSIASSFWWSIVTMSTVGYGDMTPVTIGGRIVGMCTILTGMLVLALPITVIGTNFQKVMKSVMQQTMKSNVEYLKGKKQICREEIQAILQRFHAVTEDIHLNIDDIIQVYDTDNSGTLEDDELARFRHDLEMLQNKAFMNQHLDLESSGTSATGVTAASPLAARSTPLGASSTFTSLARKLSARGTSTFTLPRGSPPPATDAGGTGTSGPSLSPPPQRSQSERGIKPALVAPALSDSYALPEGSKQSITNTDDLAMTDDEDGQSHARHQEDGNSITPLVSRSSHGPPALEHKWSEPRSSHTGSHHGHHRHSHHHSHRHSKNVVSGSRHTEAAAVIDEDPVLQRMAEMQRAFELRLQETEARIESKLLTLTKILMRVEHLIELDD